jgi:predicted DNA-binding antitoxin AbrB/MazE fold protein
MQSRPGTNGGIAITRTVRARVTGGMLSPAEPLDLPEGSDVEITVARTPTEADVAAFRRAAGRWKGTLDADALIRNVYADRLLQTRSVPRLQ